jgi:electron transport complex protein RnfG
MKIPRLVLIGGKLAVICAVAAVVLGLVNAVTAPAIVENRERALAEGLAAITSQSGLSGPAVGDPVPVAEGAVAYPITSGAEVSGYVMQLTGTGYGGDMQLLAGYYPDGELFAAQLMENQETPGLGKKAETAAYMQKFIGSGATIPVPVSKSDLPASEADAITGATITFIGVGRALSDGSDQVRALAGSGGSQ